MKRLLILVFSCVVSFALMLPAVAQETAPKGQEAAPKAQKKEKKKKEKKETKEEKKEAAPKQ
jgi:hypothetical protein